ncbi:MAG: signal peptide peptidase SppA [Spirochaetota bacterium]
MIAELTLSGSYRDAAYQVKSLMRVSRRQTFRFDRFFARCHAVRSDRKVTHVVVHVKRDFTAASVAALEEIRGELASLVSAGKQLVFYATEYHDEHLYLASVCTRRILHPLGSLRCRGLARTNLFFKRLGDKLGANVQVVRRGAYKSAMDRFRLDEIDPANLEQYSRWLEVGAAAMHDATCAGYRKPREELDELLAGRLLSSSEALEAGWVDRTVPLDALRAEWREEKHKTRTVKARDRVGRGKRIAVLFFEGSIVEGTSSYNAALGQMIGSESFVREVDALRRNNRVKAVVLRVNSGGGSAVASEDIRTALVRLAEKKPLVVSMSEVAGSGGYWIAMSGATVFALRTTLTGSIGVINLALDVGDALAKRGITHSTIRTHAHADAGGVFRKLDRHELEQLDRQVDAIYERFLALVGEYRSMSRGDVDERAQGRVWAGLDAEAQRLVDRLGGLSDAIAEARAQAGLSRARIVFRPRVKHTLVERMIYARSGTAGLAGALLGGVRTLDRIAGRPLLLEPITLFDHRTLDALNADLEIE